MSIDYLVANATKRQYFDSGVVGGSEGTTWRSILRGDSGHALAYLLSLDHELGYHLSHWVGDCFFLIGDNDGSNAPQTLRDVRRSDDLSPYWTVKNTFANISLNLIAQECSQAFMLEYYLERASSHDDMFVHLAHLVLYLDAKPIEGAFVQQFGTDWRKRYNEIMKDRPWYAVMPMRPDMA
ncbi:hypothetical protein [Bremerella sp. P1]|uniref:hypothetical protein n=1 Tax=Bremerella sp. P1 TaxID=3026424 RepID=UPI002368C13D|nr:hypothetical protein [Bremerella sp. P1]WDI42547.1 hypothetical protein PSR63_01135 [Bremerella sp. P1]